MKVSGFTFARNAVRLRYPLVESIRSVLPLVDEMVVNVGRSDDGTLDLVRGLGDPRIVVVESAKWIGKPTGAFGSGGGAFGSGGGRLSVMNWSLPSNGSEPLSKKTSNVSPGFTFCLKSTS